MPKAAEPEDDDGTIEGPRGFGTFLNQMDDGALMQELSEKLQLLSKVCGDYATRYQRAGKGTLTVTFNLTAIGATVQVASDVKVKEPKALRPGSTFWRTPGGNLTVENPRQQKLPLREVPTSGTKTKDISNEQAPVRGV